MAKYSIEDTTLTNIADAIRNKYEKEYNITETPIETKVSKTPNATGFDTFDGAYAANLSTTDTVTIEGATRIKVKISYQTEATNYDYVQITANGLAGNKLGGSTLNTEEFVYDDTDTVSFYFKSDTSNGNFLGYYAEVTGYTVVKEEIKVPYTPLEMPEAIEGIETGGGNAPFWIKLNSGSTYTPAPKLTYTDTVCESCGLWYYGIGSTGSAQSASAWRWRKKSKSDIWPMVYWPYNGGGMSNGKKYRLVFYVWCSPGKTVEWANNNIYFNDNFSTTHNLKPITENKQLIDITFTYSEVKNNYQPCLHIYPKFADTDEDTQLFMSAPIFYQADYANSGCEFPY
jgi:hypothetical protein